MRTLIVKRGFNVVGIAAGIDVLLDAQKVETLGSNSEKTLNIDNSCHTLQFVSVYALGPKSNILEIPSGKNNIRVTVNTKAGLTNTTLETKMEIQGLSQAGAEILHLKRNLGITEKDVIVNYQVWPVEGLTALLKSGMTREWVIITLAGGLAKKIPPEEKNNYLFKEANRYREMLLFTMPLLLANRTALFKAAYIDYIQQNAMVPAGMHLVITHVIPSVQEDKVILRYFIVNSNTGRPVNVDLATEVTSGNNYPILLTGQDLQGLPDMPDSELPHVIIGQNFRLTPSEQRRVHDEFLKYVVERTKWYVKGDAIYFND